MKIIVDLILKIETLFSSHGRNNQVLSPHIQKRCYDQEIGLSSSLVPELRIYSRER